MIHIKKCLEQSCTQNKPPIGVSSVDTAMNVTAYPDIVF